MKLIFIHGRDQQGKDAEALKKQWTDAWKVGLKKNQLEMPDNLEIIFPYYGDLLYELAEQARLGGDIKEVIKRGGAEMETELSFFQNFLMDLSSNAGIDDTDILKGYQGNVQEKGPLNWEWVQSILKALDHTPLGKLSLKKFTYDVFVYCMFKGIRRKINQHVTVGLDTAPCVVVAHSLGSVVAYNILREKTDWNIAKFITVGSPLGVMSVRNTLKTPLKMPESVQNGWFNAYDDRDVVALRALDSSVFPINPLIDNYGEVQNHTDNRHGIEGYLDDAVVAKRIYDALNS